MRYHVIVRGHDADSWHHHFAGWCGHTRRYDRKFLSSEEVTTTATQAGPRFRYYGYTATAIIPLGES